MTGGGSWQNAYGAGGAGNNLQGSGYTPDFGGLNSPDLNFHGYTGGDQYTPSTTPLNPYVPNIPVDGTLAPMDFTIHGPSDKGSGSSGGNVGNYGGNSNGGGMATGGTLGGGYAVDPGQWGSYGIGGDSGPQDSGAYYRSTMSRMGDAGGGIGNGMTLASFLAGKRAPVPGNTGIVPPNMQTGGALPAQTQGQTSPFGAWVNAMKGRPIKPPPAGGATG